MKTHNETHEYVQITLGKQKAYLVQAQSSAANSPFDFSAASFPISRPTRFFDRGLPAIRRSEESMSKNAHIAL